MLDFLSARSERQKEAFNHIKDAIGTYDVHAIDTLIGDITPPAELMLTQTERKIAEEQKKTFEVPLPRPGSRRSQEPSRTGRSNELGDSGRAR